MPYKTKHQVCREDSEEHLNETKQTEAELTVVEKVKSLPGHGRFHLMPVHTGEKPEK